MHLIGVGRRRLARCKSTCFGKDGRSTFGRGLPRIVVQINKQCYYPMDFPLPIMHLQSKLSGLVSKPAEKSASVRAFMLHMYWSSAEPMTKEQLVCTGGLVSQNAQCFFWVAMTSNKESKGGFKRGLEKSR